jgi:hypothetical protein
MHILFTSKNYLVESEEHELDEYWSPYSQEDLENMGTLYDKDPSQFANFSKEKKK